MRELDFTTELHLERLDAVVYHLIGSGATSVLDMGCGAGRLLSRLVEEDQFKRLMGVDKSMMALAEAREALRLSGEDRADRVELQLASFVEFDEELRGFDAAVLIEAIEHVEPTQLSCVEKSIFTTCQPGLVIITTPNQAYNVLYGLQDGTYRHPDHRFEWNGPKFKHWASGVASRQDYRVFFEDIGPFVPGYGSPTQMAVFQKI